MRVPCAIACALVCALWSPSTRADEAADKEQARAHFEEGIELFDRGDFARACPRFEASLKLFPGLGTQGKLAECYERQGRIASAWRLYREVVRLARERGEGVRAQVAGERAKNLRKRLPVLIVVPGPSTTSAGFQIQHNGVIMPPSSYGNEQYVDPGTHIVVASADGAGEWTKAVRIGERQSRTIRVPRLGGKQGEQGKRGKRDKRDKRPGAGNQTLRIGGFAAMGLGAIGLASSMYLGSRARADWREFQDGCPVGLCPTSLQPLYDDATANARYSTITFVVGTTALATGAVLWWLSRGRPAKAERRALQVVPVLGPETVGVTLSHPL